MMEKIDVNGAQAHPIYTSLTQVADAEGHSGDIRWNFEKFLVGADGSVQRFSPLVTPEDPGAGRGDRVVAGVMRSRRLGAAGPELSVIGLGGNNFGWRVRRSPLAELPPLPGYRILRTDESTLEIEVNKEQNLNGIFAALTGAGIEVLSMRNKANRLEELFLRLVEGRDVASGQAKPVGAAS